MEPEILLLHSYQKSKLGVSLRRAAEIHLFTTQIGRNIIKGQFLNIICFFGILTSQKQYSSPMDIRTFPIHAGTYLLILRLDAAADLRIGRLGRFVFPAGCYAYVGSAFGPGGLRARLKHHLRPVQHPHWHIDYLRVAAHIDAVWWLASELVYEHGWAKTLSISPGVTLPARRFGASDCQCASHLVHADVQLAFDAWCSTTGLALQRTHVTTLSPQKEGAAKQSTISNRTFC